MRGTRQAEALAVALERMPGFSSAQQIHAELRNQGEQVGLTTVYRHLQVLSEDGTVDMIRDASGETLYRRCRSPPPPDLPQVRHQRRGGGARGGTVGGAGGV